MNCERCDRYDDEQSQSRAEFEHEQYCERVDKLVADLDGYDFEDAVMDYGEITEPDVFADAIKLCFGKSADDAEKELAAWFNAGAECRAEAAAEKAHFRCD